MTTFSANIGDGTPFSANMGSKDHAPPDLADLVFYAKERTGNIFTDTHGNDAEILAPSFLNSGDASILGLKTRTSEKIFDGNDYTIYFQFKQVGDVNESGTDNVVSFGGGSIASRRGLQFRAYYNRLVCYIADGTTRYSENLIFDINTNIKNQGIFDVIVTIDAVGEQMTCGVYDSDNNLIGTAMDQDISAFDINGNDNYEGFTFNSEMFIIDSLKKFDEIKTLEQCQQDTYITDLQIHCPSIWVAADISGNQQDFWHSDVTISDIKYEDIVTWQLDYGYDKYDVGFNAEYGRAIPRNINGDSNIPSRIEGAPWGSSRIVGEFDSSSRVNLVDCAIRFTHDFFDRSNEDIWSSDARQEDYDENDTYVFNINRLNQKNIYDWLNVGYRGRLYVNFTDNSIEKYDRKLIKEIFLYATDRTLADNLEVLNYTNDIIAAVLDNNVPSYDNDNYVKLGTKKTDTGMIVFRFDDGFDDINDDWQPFLFTYNIQPIIGIHSALVGTTQWEFRPYADWDELKYYYNTLGYEICCHNNLENDYSDIEYAEQVEGDMTTGVNDQIAQGLPCEHYIGNRRSSDNPSVEYFAHKLGLYSHMAWGVMGEGGVSGANDQELNMYRLRTMACDLGGDFDLNQVDPSTEIQNVKDQLDIAKANNSLAIIMVHNFKQYVETALYTVFDYAIAENIPIYSITEALTHIKYL